MPCSNILSDIEFEENNVIDSTFQNNNEPIDITRLLEVIEKSDDLEALDEIEQIVLSDSNNLTQDINNISQQNVVLKDDINTAKCLIKELEQLHSDQVLKMEEIRKIIKLKHVELLHEQNKHIDDLDQFESVVHEIAKMFVSAPEEYENAHINGKISKIKSIFDERSLSLSQQTEKASEARHKFEEPITFYSMDILQNIFDNAVTRYTSSNNRLSLSMKKISEKLNKLRFGIKASNIAKNQDKYGHKNFFD